MENLSYSCIGSASDYRTWGDQVSVFAEYYHVYNYSRRYHYPNTREGEITDYTVSLHARDLVALLKKLNVGRVNVVAASYGAYIAFETALDNPELVQTLVNLRCSLCSFPILITLYRCFHSFWAIFLQA